MSGMHDPRLELVHRFFSGTGSTYDFMVNFATLGIDRRWKRRIVDLIPENPQRVLDLACGTGILTLAIAERYPNCHVVGVELRDEYLTIALKKVQRLGIRNVEFVLSRAEDYRSNESFNYIISSYLAKYADLKSLTHTSIEILDEGGLLLMHDFIYPNKPYLARIWRLYFWLLQHMGSRFFPAWREMYYGLPKLIEETRWILELKQALQENGCRVILQENLTANGSAIIIGQKQISAT